MKKLLPLGLTVLVVGLIVFMFFGPDEANAPESNLQPPVLTPSPEPILFEEYTASFEIYTKGTKRDFSDTKYHNRSEDAFIQNPSPSLVMVKKQGVTWSEFFNSLPSPFNLTKDCLFTGTGQRFCTDENELVFNLNGVSTPDVLDLEIEKDDYLEILVN